MSRPRKAPSIEAQLQTLILQAMQEKQFMLAERLLEIFKDFWRLKPDGGIRVEVKDAV